MASGSSFAAVVVVELVARPCPEGAIGLPNPLDELLARVPCFGGGAVTGQRLLPTARSSDRFLFLPTERQVLR